FLWWIGANVLRGLFATSSEVTPGAGRAARPFTNCPACRADVSPHEDECSFCGLLLDSGPARQLARVRSAEAEVQALAEAGERDGEPGKAVPGRLERGARVIQGLPAEPTRTARVPLPRRPVPRPAAVPAPDPAPPPEPMPAAALPSGSRPTEPVTDAP